MELGIYSLGYLPGDRSVAAIGRVLAAIASTTSTIRLSTAVTVLSTADSVRLMEQFGTLDHLSGGRVEITVGRGMFTESLALFGYSAEDYGALFEERIRLLLQLRDDPARDWEGDSSERRYAACM